MLFRRNPNDDDTLDYEAQIEILKAKIATIKEN